MSVSSVNPAGSDDQVTGSRNYDDFSVPTPTRKEQIVVEGKTLYVNLGYLAEFSSFFADCFERKVNPIFIDDYVYHEVLELMRVTFFCPQRKPINHFNINTIVTMASQYEMEPLMKRCEHVIATRADLFTSHRLFELTKTLSKHQRNSLSMSVMVDVGGLQQADAFRHPLPFLSRLQRLAQLDNDQFESLPFNAIPGDVVADLYAMKLHEAQERAHRKEMWPRVKSVLKCGWLIRLLRRRRRQEGGGDKSKKDVHRSISAPAVTTSSRNALRANEHATRSYPMAGDAVAGRKKKSAKLVTSTPIVPGKRVKFPRILRTPGAGGVDSGEVGSDLETNYDNSGGEMFASKGAHS